MPLEMDESFLSAGIFQSLRKCIQLREKYVAAGLQRKSDNPRDYPNIINATKQVDDGVLPSAVQVRTVNALRFSLISIARVSNQSDWSLSNLC